MSLGNLQRAALFVGALGLALSLVAWLIDPSGFYAAWLVGWFYWLSVAVGCMGFFMIYRLTGGQWGRSLERIFLAGTRTFEALAVMFLPLLGGFHALYLWSRPDAVQGDPQLMHNHPYLNIGPWCARAAICFGLWIYHSRVLEKSRFEAVRLWSGGGMVLLFITASFSGIDWIMSLEPRWYSTVYGLIILTGQGIAGLSFALLFLHALKIRLPRWNPPLTHKVLKDHGSILLTTCILWTYVSFVQWLIIWIGNVPETVTWYVSRSRGAWSGIAWAVFIGQFLIPFQLLIWQAFKNSTRKIAWLAGFLLLVHALELYWLVVPALRPDHPMFHWWGACGWLAVGGFWFAFFIYRLRTLEPTSAGCVETTELGELLHA